jgi:hypothetical protein
LADPAADPLAVGEQLTGLLRNAIGPDQLTAAAAAFTAAQGDVAVVLDLGTVAPDVARDQGYDCLAPS